MKITVVVTSIAAPNPILAAIADGCASNDWRFVVIGDKKSPPGFQLDNCEFFDLDRQLATEFRSAVALPTGHYARKNLGYLIAIRDGAEVIVETDDDNIPTFGFFAPRAQSRRSKRLDDGGWVNVYGYFSTCTIWPRGLPLDAIHAPLPRYEELREDLLDCPIQQGLANQNPDVDAVYRLVLPLPVIFEIRGDVALGNGSWCPFNSQNTSWWPAAFPLLYLPSFCSFRMTDIWRSFVAQRIAWVNNWYILFHGPTVDQQRNEHNLMLDFSDEIPGYVHNRRIAEALRSVPVKAGASHVGDNLILCYERLVGLGVIDSREIRLCETWLTDLKLAINSGTRHS